MGYALEAWHEADWIRQLPVELDGLFDPAIVERYGEPDRVRYALWASRQLERAANGVDKDDEPLGTLWARCLPLLWLVTDTTFSTRPVLVDYYAWRTVVMEFIQPGGPEAPLAASREENRAPLDLGPQDHLKAHSGSYWQERLTGATWHDQLGRAATLADHLHLFRQAEPFDPYPALLVLAAAGIDWGENEPFGRGVRTLHRWVTEALTDADAMFDAR